MGVRHPAGARAAAAHPLPAAPLQGVGADADAALRGDGLRGGHQRPHDHALLHDEGGGHEGERARGADGRAGRAALHARHAQRRVPKAPPAGEERAFTTTRKVANYFTASVEVGGSSEAHEWAPAVGRRRTLARSLLPPPLPPPGLPVAPAPHHLLETRIECQKEPFSRSATRRRRCSRTAAPPPR